MLDLFDIFSNLLLLPQFGSASYDVTLSERAGSTENLYQLFKLSATAGIFFALLDFRLINIAAFSCSRKLSVPLLILVPTAIALLMLLSTTIIYILTTILATPQDAEFVNTVFTLFEKSGLYFMLLLSLFMMAECWMYYSATAKYDTKNIAYSEKSMFKIFTAISGLTPIPFILAATHGQITPDVKVIVVSVFSYLLGIIATYTATVLIFSILPYALQLIKRDEKIKIRTMVSIRLFSAVVILVNTALLIHA